MGMWGELLLMECTSWSARSRKTHQRFSPTWKRSSCAMEPPRTKTEPWRSVISTEERNMRGVGMFAQVVHALLPSFHDASPKRFTSASPVCASSGRSHPPIAMMAVSATQHAVSAERGRGKSGTHPCCQLRIAPSPACPAMEAATTSSTLTLDKSVLPSRPPMAKARPIEGTGGGRGECEKSARGCTGGGRGDAPETLAWSARASAMCAMGSGEQAVRFTPINSVVPMHPREALPPAGKPARAWRATVAQSLGSALKRVGRRRGSSQRRDGVFST